MKIVVFAIAISLFCNQSFAQNVGIGTNSPNPNAQLDIASDSKGVLIPRLTKNQRNALPQVQGMLVYDSDDNRFYYSDGTQWRIIVNTNSGDAWFTQGNSNTNAAVNAIGTIDKRPLRFIVFNQRSGYIDTSGSVSFGRAAMLNNPATKVNTAFGDSVLYNNGTGATATEAIGNTGIGSKSLRNNTTGYWNTATGMSTLTSNTTGMYNTANGAEALYANTSGYGNTAIGLWALRSNTIGTTNVAIGIASLYSNSNGYSNVAIGWESLFDNNGGYQNIAIGAQALKANTLGYDNTGAGHNALYRNTLGYENIALGPQSLFENIDGFRNLAFGKNSMNKNTMGDENIAAGTESLFSNSTGNRNIAIGNMALHNNTGKSNLIAIGDSALYSNGNGSFFGSAAENNIAIGTNALKANTAGQSNTGIGWLSLTANTQGLQNTAIGANTLTKNITTGNNTAVGNGALMNSTTDNNTAMGSFALNQTSTGFNNTAAGYQSFYLNTTGFQNTGFGNLAGQSNTTGSNLTAIGYNASFGANNLTNASAIGANAVVSTSNSLVLGNNVKVGIGTSSPGTSLSVMKVAGANATASFSGTSFSSEFNLGSFEDTYIRGGLSNSVVFINPTSAGQIQLGSPVGNNNTEVFGKMFVNTNPLGSGGLNIVPLGIIDYEVRESDDDGSSIGGSYQNISGSFIQSANYYYNSSAGVGDASITGRFWLNPSITSQYAKIIAVGYPNFKCTGTFSNAIIYNLTSEVQADPGNPSQKFLYVSLVADDFPAVGVNKVWGTVIFYGVR